MYVFVDNFEGCKEGLHKSGWWLPGKLWWSKIYMRFWINWKKYPRQVLCFLFLFFDFSLVWQVAGLVQYVEETFIEHFAESNRSKGMKMLRPKATRERHRLTFSTGKNQKLASIGFCKFKLCGGGAYYERILVSGFSAGCVFSLIVALAAIIRTRNSLQGKGQEIYMNTMFPLYR